MSTSRFQEFAYSETANQLQPTIATMSNSELSQFKFSDPAGDEVSIRTAGTAEAPLFCVKDVCCCLGIVNQSQKCKILDEHEKGLHPISTPGGLQKLIFITESGLYKLVLSCRNATKRGTAPHRFMQWITTEVLPTIRRTGSYAVPTARTAPAIEFNLDVAKFLHSSLVAERALAMASKDQRKVDFFTGRIDSTLQQTYVMAGLGPVADPMMVEDSPSELITVTEAMEMMGDPYSSYEYSKHKIKVGRFVAKQFREEFVGEEIPQTTKTLANGHRTAVKAYPNKAWVEEQIVAYFTEIN